MSDEELKKLEDDVARKVMGYDPCPCWFSFNTGPNGECERCGKRCALPYARSIAAAWQVVEKITENPLWDFILAVLPHLTTATFRDGNAVNFEEMDESVPIAICLAALKAVRAGKPKTIGQEIAEGLEQFANDLAKGDITKYRATRVVREDTP